MRILTVTACETVQAALKGAIKVLGHDLLAAESRREMLALLPAYHPDIALIILDLDLPDAAGLDALEEVKSHVRFGAIPVLVLINHRADSDAIAAIRAGARDCLPRDCTQQDLVTRMFECLGHAA
jgi:DNA-binding NarL/FixJ family response regulator